MEKYYEAYLNESRKEFRNTLKNNPKSGKTAKEAANEDKLFLKAMCDYVTYTPNKNYTITL